jgi:hypothetical protein
MPETTYSYVAADFPNSRVNPSQLQSEIGASSIVTAIERIDTVGGTLSLGVVDGPTSVDIIFKDALSTGDKTTLDNDTTGPAGGLLAAHTALSIEEDKRTSDGKLIVSVFPTAGTKRTTLVTHDFTDPTTWYGTAVRIVDEVASHDNPPNDYTQYSVANTPLVDSYHGNIFKEDFLEDDNGDSYRVVVKVNDVEQTEEDPHVASPNGDYVVDYVNGTITFHTALTAPDVVKVTYHHVQDSTYTLKPGSGKKLEIVKSEVQFSTDMVMGDTVVFQPYGLVEVFAPSLTPTPYPAGTLIPLGDPLHYKTIRDFVGESNGALPTIPALGGGGWRATANPVCVMPWDYAAVTELSSAAGMEIRISLEHDDEFTGEYGTATFYCLSEDE